MQTLTNNFRFLFLEGRAGMVRVQDLQPGYKDVFEEIVLELYKNLGLDVMMSSFFIC